MSGKGAEKEQKHQPTVKRETVNTEPLEDSTMGYTRLIPS